MSMERKSEPKRATERSMQCPFERVVGARRSKPAPRVRFAKLIKTSARDRPADVRHEPLVEPNIMHGNQNRAKHLGGKKEMPQRPAAEIAAGVAVATALDGPAVPLILRVSQPDRPAGGEGVGGATIPSRQHAIVHCH